MFNLFMNANKKRAKKRGFTLIELVIVIVILGVLAGVAALSFGNVTTSSRAGVAKANLRALKSACQIYAVDHNGKLPTAFNDAFKKYLDPALEKAIGNTEGYTYSIAATGTTAADKKVTLKVEGPGIEVADEAATIEIAGDF